MKKSVYIGGIPVGNGKITIQSMTNTRTSDIDATKRQILALKDAGADFVRISLPDFESANAVKFLSKCDIPLIGDVHFLHKPALIAIENGISKIRINPSNMKREDLKEVVKLCADKDIPIRVGVNKGSVKEKTTAEDLAHFALETAHIIEDLGWNKLVLAVKTSDVSETVSAYRVLAKITDYPLHIGLTEAGTIKNGFTKSAIAIGSLLLDGIGDTVRVSLTGDPVKEIYAAKQILRAVGIDKNFVNVISCPTCARTEIPIIELAESIEEMTREYDFPLKIAVMGCIVNGIGEGKDADFGVAGGKDNSIIFKNGEILKNVRNCDILNELIALIQERKG